MRLEEFDYNLPDELIAQHPCPERDQSRLMIVDRRCQSIQHARFDDIPGFLNPGDILVFNNTRVIKARLFGRRRKTRGKWEGLFLEELPDGAWRLLSQTRGRLTAGEIIDIEPGPLALQLIKKTPERHWLAKPLHEDSPGATTFELLNRHGHIPLPQYIRGGRAGPDDVERYQTMFATRPGAVASPTAGLHFTPRVMQALKERHTGWTFVTLHVGIGTFQPIRTDLVEDHAMHSEWGELDDDASRQITRSRSAGNRIVAVGTTSVRVLETAARKGSIEPWGGLTDLYIHPPHQFRAVDALVTNFHLPRSSLLVLVSALAGVDLIRRAYKIAVDQSYRFYSYGDAMLIL
jgi:S-adenosylmethionine:tRNA ribosyltransferase-isomerase